MTAETPSSGTLGLLDLDVDQWEIVWRAPPLPKAREAGLEAGGE
jgi:hypothetical protein